MYFSFCFDKKAFTVAASGASLMSVRLCTSVEVRLIVSSCVASFVNVSTFIKAYLYVTPIFLPMAKALGKSFVNGVPFVAPAYEVATPIFCADGI